MADYPNLNAKIKISAPLPHQSRAVCRVASAVVEEIGIRLDETVLAKLYTAVVSPDADDCRQAVKEVVATGVRPEDLSDFYIPSIARKMGDLWCVDELSFASVTIGASRLQAMLRVLGPDWSSNAASDPHAPSLLLVVPQDVYHTLGAIVLSGQLRRKGLSVKLILGGKPEDIAKRISITKYDGIFISSSVGEALYTLRLLVDAVRSSTKKPPPIVVGGTILEVETKENVIALTGADYATRNPEEALKLCGLQDITHNSIKMKHGT